MTVILVFVGIAYDLSIALSLAVAATGGYQSPLAGLAFVCSFQKPTVASPEQLGPGFVVLFVVGCLLLAGVRVDTQERDETAPP
jgi:hypothetical protein